MYHPPMGAGFPHASRPHSPPWPGGPAGRPEEGSSGSPAPKARAAAVRPGDDDDPGPDAALPGLIGKWRDRWCIRYEGGKYRAYGRDSDEAGVISYDGTEIAACTASGLDAGLTAWEAL